MNEYKKAAHLQDKPLADFQEASTDPQGSYTGVPLSRDDTPVQDADDL